MSGGHEIEALVDLCLRTSFGSAMPASLKVGLENSQKRAATVLPSSQASVGRFVKAAFYANYVRKAKTPDEAITTLAYIMNNFDRPYDLTVDGAGSVGDGPGDDVQSTEVSWVLFLHDLSRNLFYVRSINAMNWSVIDINKLKDIKEVKSINSYDVNQAGADEFNLFYK